MATFRGAVIKNNIPNHFKELKSPPEYKILACEKTRILCTRFICSSIFFIHFVISIKCVFYFMLLQGILHKNFIIWVISNKVQSCKCENFSIGFLTSENILIILHFNTKGILCYINVLLLLLLLLKTYQQFVATTITTNK